MAIEEKKRSLEFTYTSENKDCGMTYDIVYDDSDVLFPLQISGPLQVSRGTTVSKFPVELFVEVVNFLSTKGIIKNNFLNKELKLIDKISIPIPKIQKKDILKVGSVDESFCGENEFIVADPLSSFDINSVIEGNKSFVVEQKIDNNRGKVFSESVSEDIPEEALSRAVIRNSSSDESDPLKSEREASEIRLSLKKDKEKTIKRARE